MQYFYSVENAGHFISRGFGKHEIRVINSIELIYVLSGTLDIFEDEKAFHVSAGERLYLFPGRKHGGLGNYKRNLSFLWVHFFPLDYAAEENLSKSAQYAKISFKESFSEYFQMLLAEQHFAIGGQEKKKKTMDFLMSILVNEASILPAIDPLKKTKYLAEEANHFISLHFSEGLSTAEIARYLHCHPNYLSRIYRENYKKTISDAIRIARISKACILLKGTKKSIKEISFEAGYCDVSYFRKQFFRENSMTPHAYRVLHTSGHRNTE